MTLLVVSILQYHDLERSLTKQASEWVALKKRELKTEKGVKWSQVMECAPLVTKTHITGQMDW